MDRPPSATATDDSAANQRFELLLDMPLEVTVQLGRTRMTIHELLALGPGV